MLTERYYTSGKRPGCPPELRIGGEGSSLGSIPLDTLHQTLHLPTVTKYGGPNIGSHNNLSIDKVDEASKRPCRGFEDFADDAGNFYLAITSLLAPGISPTASLSRAPLSPFPHVLRVQQLVSDDGYGDRDIDVADDNGALNIGLYEHGIGHPNHYLADCASPAWVGSAVSG